MLRSDRAQLPQSGSAGGGGIRILIRVPKANLVAVGDKFETTIPLKRSSDMGWIQMTPSSFDPFSYFYMYYMNGKLRKRCYER
jgi:hypothetical protein